MTPDRVVEEAELLLDEAPDEALSLAAIAARLGVQVPSLYKHVGGLPALRRLVAARATAELAGILEEAVSGLDGDEAVTAVAHAYRGWATAHPGRYRFTLSAPDPDDTELAAAASRAVDVIYTALAPLGVVGTDALDATRTLRATLHGFVALELVGGFGLPREVDRTFARTIAAQLAAFRGWGAEG